MDRYYIIGALLILAGIFYFLGSTSGAVAFIVVGALVEIAFWFVLLTDPKDKDSKSEERL